MIFKLIKFQYHWYSWNWNSRYVLLSIWNLYR